MSVEIFPPPQDPSDRPDRDVEIYPGNPRQPGKAGEDQEEDKDQERHYTLSISDEDRDKSFEIEDKRWSSGEQVRDWVILIILILIWLTFQVSFYFLVPGIR